MKSLHLTYLASPSQIDGFARGLKPTENLLVSEWAEKYRYLSKTASAESGRWRNSRTPFLTAIMDDLSPSSPVERVVFMKGSQVGGTECGLNWLGFCIDICPAPVMAVQPTVDIAIRYSKQRITPMIQESPQLRNKVRSNVSRASGNTLLTKEFLGGVLNLAGANSAAALRSLPIRFLFLDEISAYPVDCDGEGDSVELAIARTRSFARRKIFLNSTPTIKGFCRIENAFLETQQHKYFVPCPHCNKEFYLTWSNIKWINDDPETAYCECPNCQGEIKEHHKTKMLRLGEWRPTEPDKSNGKIKGYHLSALYSPVGMFSWVDAVKQFIDAKDSPTKLKTFTNTVLGETWEDQGESVDEGELIARAESYVADPLPEGVGLITAGVDVNKNFATIEILGHGRDGETWSLDYIEIHGRITSEMYWERIENNLDRTFTHHTGQTLRIAASCIDSGYETQQVYDFVRPRQGKNFLAIKGMPGEGRAPISPPPKARPDKVPVYTIGTFTLKNQLYNQLQTVVEPGPSYCHFPTRYSVDYYKGLTAEKLVQSFDPRGFVKRVWVKDENQRNEPLDCRVYAMAAKEFLNIDINTLCDSLDGQYEETA